MNMHMARAQLIDLFIYTYIQKYACMCVCMYTSVEHPPYRSASPIDTRISTLDSQRDDYLRRMVAVRVWEWFVPYEDGDC